MPTTWSLTDRRMGIRWTTSGHQQNKPRAHTANTAGNECPNNKIYFGHYHFYFQQAFKENIMKKTCMDAHLSYRQDYLLSEKADRFIVESKQLDGIRTKISKHNAINPQTFLRWNEVSDREKIKQKTGKGWKSQKSAKNETSMRLFATIHKKYHLLYRPINQCITNILKSKMTLWDFSFKKNILKDLQLYLYSLILPLEHEYYIHY